jgi:hypothetical protein
MRALVICSRSSFSFAECTEISARCARCALRLLGPAERALVDQLVERHALELGGQIPEGDVHPAVSPAEIGSLAQPLANHLEVVRIDAEEELSDVLAEGLALPIECRTACETGQPVTGGDREESVALPVLRIAGDPAGEERGRKRNVEVVKLDLFDLSRHRRSRCDTVRQVEPDVNVA